MVNWVSSPLSICPSAFTTAAYIFTTYTITIITLESCALNAEFQHFILRFNKISLLCRYHWKRGWGCKRGCNLPITLLSRTFQIWYLCSKKPPKGEFLVLRFRDLTKGTLHFCKIHKLEIILYFGKGTVPGFLSPASNHQPQQMCFLLPHQMLMQTLFTLWKQGKSWYKTLFTLWKQGESWCKPSLHCGNDRSVDTNPFYTMEFCLFPAFLS